MTIIRKAECPGEARRPLAAHRATDDADRGALAARCPDPPSRNPIAATNSGRVREGAKSCAEDFGQGLACYKVDFRTRHEARMSDALW